MSNLALSDFKVYARSEIANVDDSLLQMVIDAAEIGINQSCQRKFFVAGASSARVYAPDYGSNILRIHDCTAVTSVVDNSTTLTVTTDYQLEPLNSLDWAGSTRPYEQVRKLRGYWYSVNHKATATITATWGWAAIPAAITEATLVLAKDILKLRETTGGYQSFGDMGIVRARENLRVASLIAPFKRVEAFGVA